MYKTGTRTYSVTERQKPECEKMAKFGTTRTAQRPLHDASCNQHDYGSSNQNDMETRTDWGRRPAASAPFPLSLILIQLCIEGITPVCCAVCTKLHRATCLCQSAQQRPMHHLGQTVRHHQTLATKTVVRPYPGHLVAVASNCRQRHLK